MKKLNQLLVIITIIWFILFIFFLFSLSTVAYNSWTYGHSLQGGWRAIHLVGGSLFWKDNIILSFIIFLALLVNIFLMHIKIKILFILARLSTIILCCLMFLPWLGVLVMSLPQFGESNNLTIITAGAFLMTLFLLVNIIFLIYQWIRLRRV